MPSLASLQAGIVAEYALLAEANPKAYTGDYPLPVLEWPTQSALGGLKVPIADFEAPTDDHLALIPAGKAGLFRNLLLYYAFEAAAGAFASAGFELFAGRTTVDGRAAAYVCEDFVCRLPVTDPAWLT